MTKAHIKTIENVIAAKKLACLAMSESGAGAYVRKTKGKNKIRSQNECLYIIYICLSR